MASEKQTQANRRNARRSTGPKTHAGKKRSRWNALKHGVLASASVLDLPGYQEDRAAFRQLLIALRRDLRPRGAMQELLVERIASCYWRLGRVMRAEAGEINQTIESRSQNAVWTQQFQRQVSSLLPSAPDDALRNAAPSTVAALDECLALLEELEEAILNAQPNTLDWKVILLECTHGGYPRPWLLGIQDSLDLIAHDESISDDQRAPMMIAVLHEDADKLAASRPSIQKRENQQQSLHDARVLVPGDDQVVRLSRYEAALERSLFRALAALMELQRRRPSHQPLAPPNNLRDLPPGTN